MATLAVPAGCHIDNESPLFQQGQCLKAHTTASHILLMMAESLSLARTYYTQQSGRKSLESRLMEKKQSW